MCVYICVSLCVCVCDNLFGRYILNSLASSNPYLISHMAGNFYICSTLTE